MVEPEALTTQDQSRNTVPRRPWGPAAAIFWTLVFFIAPQILLGFVVGGVQDYNPGFERWAEANEVLYTTLIYGAAELVSVGLLIFFLYGRRYRLRHLIGTGFRPLFVPLVIGSFVLYFVLSTAIIALASLVFPGVNIEEAQTTGFEGAISGFELLLTGVSLVVLPPLTEELLFRGFLFRGLRSKLTFVGAALISSALFGLAHGQVNVGLDTFALALVLSFLVEKTNSLWPAILLHAVKNALAFTLVYILGV